MSRFVSGRFFSRACVHAGVAVCAVFAVSGTGVAQDVPGSADVGRAAQPFVEDRIAPLAGERIEVPDVALAGAPAGADKVFFTLAQVRIEGAQVYGESDIAPLYAAMIGERVSLADIYAVSARLTAKYRNDGYVLTQVIVPPQSIDDTAGVVRLQVVEGRIAAVSVEGEEGAAMELIRAYAARLSGERALNVRDLEHVLILINDLPGVNARSILRPSDQVGAADLRILVTRRPYDAVVSANTYGSRYLGPLQFSGAVALNNQIFGYNERVTAQIAVSPDFGNGLDIELAYGALSYKQPIGTYGTTAEAFVSHTRTEPGFTLEQFDVEGRSTYGGVTLEHPFLRTRSLSVLGRATLDARNIRSSSTVETRKDRMRAARLGGRVEFLENWIGMATNALDVQLSKGLGLFGASDKGDANMSRANAEPSFFKVEAEVQRLQRISNSVNLLVAMRGQWSAHALLSSEEFGAGGMEFGRGFDPSEIVGDHGLAGKMELQWNTPYALNFLESYQLFSFFDAARVWNKDPATPAFARETLTSAGLGVRAQITAKTSADVTLAIPLNRDVATQGDKDARVFFGLTYRF